MPRQIYYSLADQQRALISAGAKDVHHMRSCIRPGLEAGETIESLIATWKQARPDYFRSPGHSAAARRLFNSARMRRQ